MQNIDSSELKTDVVTVSNEYLELPLDIKEAIQQFGMYDINQLVGKPIEFEIHLENGETTTIKVEIKNK